MTTEEKLKEICRLGSINPEALNSLEIDGVLDRIITMKRKEILAQHPYKIWQGKDSRWRTYVDKTDKPHVLLAKSTLKKIEDSIIEAYERKAVTVENVFSDWLAYKLEVRAIIKNTADRYQNDFDTYFVSCGLSCRPIREVSANDIENFIDGMLGSGISQKRFSNVRTVLFGIFRFAKKMGLTSLSISAVVNDIEISKRSFQKASKRPEEQIFFMKELEQIMEYCDQNPTIPNLGIAIAARTGVRIGELAALRFSDVGKNTIHIQRTEIKHKNEEGKTVWEIREMPKTEAGDRRIYVGEKVLRDIEKLRSMQHTTDYLFEVNGHWMQSFYFDRALRRICQRLGIPVRSMHKLRRTYGTNLINHHVEDSLVLSQMGHTSIDTTRKYYYFDNLEDERKMQQIQNVVSF